MKEFWNSLLTEKSWEILQEFRKKYDFILIGGWAAYILTKRQKSKDIDIVVDLSELQKLKQENLLKNDRLKKYEIKKEIDIDIYVEHFSQLTIPVEDIKDYSIETQGFKIASPELLLILKQGAYLDRKNSIKGEKDLIDIISLVLFANPDFKKYYSIIKRYSLEDYRRELIDLIKNYKDYNELNLSPNEFKKLKSKILLEI